LGTWDYSLELSCRTREETCSTDNKKDWIEIQNGTDVEAPKSAGFAKEFAASALKSFA
jgi:hypothetical protein